MKRSVSAVSTWGGDQDGAYKADGTINTGYISNWRQLSNEDKKKVLSERKKQGVKLVDGKVIKTWNELDNIKELKEKKSNFKTNTKSLKKKVTNKNDEGDDNEEPEDAGEHFGGNQSKKKSKKNWLLGLHYYVPWSLSHILWSLL